jgi:hypothetical protein
MKIDFYIIDLRILALICLGLGAWIGKININSKLRMRGKLLYNILGLLLYHYM